MGKAFYSNATMKPWILLLPMLAMAAAQSRNCECDFVSHELICKGLRLISYDRYVESCGHTYWKIDLSENKLEGFPDDLRQFRKVNLSRNSLEHLEASVKQKVNYLDVSNNIITRIDFENNFLSLRHLDISNNYLGLLDDDFLEGQCNVEHLDVSGNRIATLHAVTICAELSVLVASRNQISEISKNIVLLKKLEVLDLSRNNIHRLSGLPTTLEILDLNGNEIRVLSYSSLRGLTSLKHLDLAGNGLRGFEKDAFATLSSLETLRLKGNYLKVLTADSFKGLKSLVQINLSLNDIESLSNDTFSDMSSLKSVYLELNKLKSLPALQFGRKVHHISFSGNSIERMNLEPLIAMFTGSRVERTIYLNINNFRGDDPEWSKVLKYFDWECSRDDELRYQRIILDRYQSRAFGKEYLLASTCPCARFQKDKWRFRACISEMGEVDGLPWLEAAEVYAGLREEEEDHRSTFKRDEF